MVAVVMMPMTVFAIPVWIQVALVIAGVGVSAILSGLLQQRPKLNQIVMIVALVTVFMANAVRVHQRPALARPDFLQSELYPVLCDGYWYWVNGCFLWQ